MMTSPPLYVGSLKVPSDSFIIGPAHRQVLREKRDQMEQALFKRRAELEGRLSASPGNACSGTPTEHTGHKTKQQRDLDAMYQECQARLDQLFERFKREWSNNPREKSFSGMELPGGDESGYMAQAVGRALTHSLAELCVKKPVDPIEYLSHLLRKYAENVRRSQEQAVNNLQVRLAEEDREVEEEHTEEIEREKIQMKQEEARRKEIFLKSSPRPEDENSQSSISGTADVRLGSSSTGHDVTPRVAGDAETNLYTIEEKEGEISDQGRKEESKNN